MRRRKPSLWVGLPILAIGIAETMRRRLQLRRKKLNLSYADALGYTVAVRPGLRFLTGDEEFETLDDVEYVKWDSTNPSKTTPHYALPGRSGTQPLFWLSHSPTVGG